MPGIGEDLQTSEEFNVLEIEDETLENLENGEEFIMPEVSAELENEENFNISEILVEEQPEINNKVNLIMANVPENDFQADDFTNIQENPIIKFFKNIQNKLTQKRLTDGQITQKSEKSQHY